METNPTRNHEVAGLIPGLAQWVKNLVSCGVSRRCGSALALLWLWGRPAAVAPIRPLAWEPPYAMGVALKSKKKKRTMFHCLTTGLMASWEGWDPGSIPGPAQWVKDSVLPAVA